MSLNTKSPALVLSQTAVCIGVSRACFCLKSWSRCLLNQRQVLSRSAESKSEQDILQYVHNKQHPPVSQAIACQCLMTEWCVLGSQFFHPNQAPARVCTLRSHRSVGLLAGQGTIQWGDTHQVLWLSCCPVGTCLQCQSQMRLTHL